MSMARLLKCVTRIGLETSVETKGVLKFSGAFWAFSRHGELLHQKRTCHSYMRKMWMESCSKRNFSQTSRIVPFNLSDIGEGIKEVTLKEWFVKVGDKVSQFDNICEVQSDKASVTITSRYDGIITKLHYDIDEIAPVGKPLVDLQINEEPVVAENIQSVSTEEHNEKTDHLDAKKVLATPSVRRLAAEHHVNLNAVKGTGRDGRILKEDVLAYLGMIEKPTSDKENIGQVRRTSEENEVLLSKDTITLIQGIKKSMVKTMTDANTIPHFVYSDEIIVDKLVNYCSQLKQYSKTVKITYMPFFIKAASIALQEFPIINASVDEACETIVYKSSHNIGVAMDTSSGLLVPNIKNVQNMNIIEIAMELNRLHKLGLQGKLSPSDLAGGTFTLSNIGTIGGTYAKPVILPPQVAIGAIGKIQALPRYNENDEVVKTNIVCINWAADHRIIDGATMARFSNMWKSYVENPILIMLNLK